MVQLYTCGNVGAHHGHGGGDINAKANSLGFHGPAYQFDTAFLNPRDGTFVELTSQGAGNRCSLRYKRNEKVAYTGGLGGAAMRYSAVTNTWAPRAAGQVAAAGANKRFFGQHTITTGDIATQATYFGIP